MDEVDRIIISTLQELGCSTEDVQSLAEFSIALVVEGTVRCLTAILPEFNCPMTLPVQVAKQFRLGQQLADSCTALGYRGEVGYQTFLYPNVIEWRRIFVFLIESLPKAARAVGDSSASEQALLQRRMTKALQDCMLEYDAPPPLSIKPFSDPHIRHFRSQGMHRTVPLTIAKAENKTNFEKNFLPPISSQQYCPGVLYWNPWAASCLDFLNTQRALLAEVEYLELQQTDKHGFNTQVRRKEMLLHKLGEGMRRGIKSAQHNDQQNLLSNPLSDVLDSFQSTGAPLTDHESVFQSTEKFHFSQFKSPSRATPQTASQLPGSQAPEDPKKQREQLRDELTERLAELSQKIASTELEINRLELSTQSMWEQLLQLQQKNKENRELIKQKRRVLELAGDTTEEGEANAEKMDNVIEEILARIKAASEAWEEKRIQLYKQLRALSDTADNEKLEIEKEMKKSRELKEAIKECALESQVKDASLAQLKEEYERMNKDTQRNSYTKRIMEILANIQKQKKEIERVLFDMKQVQKEINQLEGKIGRVFALADEKFFKEAKKSESLRNLYKNLVSLHSTFGEIINTIEQTGSIDRSIKDLEDQISDEKAKEVGRNLKSMQKDYQALKNENEELKAKIAAASK